MIYGSTLIDYKKWLVPIFSSKHDGRNWRKLTLTRKEKRKPIFTIVSTFVKAINGIYVKSFFIRKKQYFQKGLFLMLQNIYEMAYITAFVLNTWK